LIEKVFISEFIMHMAVHDFQNISKSAPVGRPHPLLRLVRHLLPDLGFPPVCPTGIHLVCGLVELVTSPLDWSDYSQRHTTGTHQVHTASESSIRYSPKAPSPFPLNATLHLATRPLSSPAGSKGGVAGPSVPASTVSSQFSHRRSSAHGQEQYSHSSEPAPYQQPEQMQLYPQQLYNTPTYATPAEIVSLANGPSSHIPPPTNPTASGANPNSGVGPSGPNVNMSGASGEPTPFNQQIGPSRTNKNNRRQLSKPCQRPTSAPRKTRPIPYERNLVRLQQRCRRQGADEGAIGLLGKIFANEVSLLALTRQLTDTEAETKEFGIENGKVYNALLEYLNEEDGVVPRYNCRLCHSEQTWKHPRDVLRHLRRDHVGLADVCDQWYVFDCSLMLACIHIVLPAM